MIRYISKMRKRYYLPLITALLGASSVVVAVITGGLVGIKVGVNVGTKKNLTEKNPTYLM